MGRLFKRYLSGGTIWRCTTCHSHLALNDELLSKNFMGRFGKAFLFGTVINVSMGPKEDRQLTTGMHTVQDLICCGCGEIIGWYYSRAWEETQKYKEGRFILEKFKMEKISPQQPLPLPSTPPPPPSIPPSAGAPAHFASPS